MVSAIHCVELSDLSLPPGLSYLQCILADWHWFRMCSHSPPFSLPQFHLLPSHTDGSVRLPPRCSYSLAGCSHKSAGLSFFLTGLLSLFPVHCDFYVHVSCGWQSFFTIFVFTSCQLCPAYTKMYWRAHCTKTEENKAKQKHKISTNTYKHT